MPPPMSAALAAPLALLARQSSIEGEAEGVKNTFSSWDACMEKSYCKYPVIIAIVIGSLIVLSIIFCIVRCCCCGLECCCGICSCFNACCPSPRGGRSQSKYKDPERTPHFQPSPYQGYQSQPQPFYNSQPQYAHFETGRSKGGDDALPAMPSWGTAAERRVEDHTPHDEVELGRIDPDQEQKAPMLANQQPAPHGGHEAYRGAAYSDAMPYQRHIAQEGGDLGVAPAAAAAYGGAGAAGAAGYRNPQQQQSQRPALNPGYSSYSSVSQPSSYTAQAGGAHELHGASPPPQQSYAAPPAYQPGNPSLPSALSTNAGQQSYQPYSAATARKPVEGSWRDV